MKKITLIPMSFLMIIFVALLLPACGGDSGDSSSDGGSSTDVGTLSLRLTDAPVDDLHEVWVTFTEVIIHPADGSGDIVVDVTDAAGDGMMIELKALGEGNSVRLLDEESLPAGDYSWMRLVIDSENTYVVVDQGGAELRLGCPSCEQSGLKLNRSFTIEAEGAVDFTIDFDLRKSITLTQPNSTPYEDDQFKLRPTLRIIETDVADAYIYGTVDEALAPGAPDECTVYLYEGDAGVIEPDDICILDDAAICPETDRPLTTAGIKQENGFYSYRSGYLYAGIYTVALLCEDDDPEVDDDVDFIGEAGVEAVSGGSEHNFSF